MNPVAAATLVFRGLLVLALIGAVLYAVGGMKHLVTAPLETRLEVSEANNKGFKAAADKQNAGVDGLKKAGDVRKKRSAAAVEGAGKEELAAAARIQASPAPGPTPLARAANRINAEFGQ